MTVAERTDGIATDCILELCRIALRTVWSFYLRALQLDLRRSLEETIGNVLTMQYAVMTVDMAMNTLTRH
jgi:hypothetical protein